MGSPAWAAGLDSVGVRAAREDEIVERIAEWTAGRDRDDLFHGLQAAGVTAGPVLNAAEAANDPHLAASEAWKRLPATADYPEVDWLRPAYRFSRSDVDLRTPPCLFGEHNEYVYKELLGVSDEEFERFKAEGHIADSYAPEVIANA
jgi:crotonobetainyl-CoA:carnitine CoA-transferase CaiB-like acyl-CoA transferase